MSTERPNFDHYVAQHYIKRFANDAGIVYVGNIQSQSVEPVTDTSKVMGDTNWSLHQAVEDAFSAVEDQVAVAFTRLQQDPTAISGLAQPTRDGIRNFIVMHLARSTGIHNNMDNATKQMTATLKPYAPYSKEIAAMGDIDVTRADSLEMGINVGSDLDQIFEMKGCVALIAPAGDEFVLGDNPFVNISSQEHFHMRGAIFAPETYFWFPLNSRIGLFFATDLGNPISQGKIKHRTISRAFVRELNKAEVYLAVDLIAGSRRGFVKKKVRLPNVGPQRSEVVDLGWAPFIITQNKAVYQIDREGIDELRLRFN